MGGCIEQDSANCLLRRRFQLAHELPHTPAVLTSASLNICSTHRQTVRIISKQAIKEHVASRRAVRWSNEATLAMARETKVLIQRTTGPTRRRSRSSRRRRPPSPCRREPLRTVTASRGFDSLRGHTTGFYLVFFGSFRFFRYFTLISHAQPTIIRSASRPRLSFRGVPGFFGFIRFFSVFSRFFRFFWVLSE